MNTTLNTYHTYFKPPCYQILEDLCTVRTHTAMVQPRWVTVLCTYTGHQQALSSYFITLNFTGVTFELSRQLTTKFNSNHSYLTTILKTIQENHSTTHQSKKNASQFHRQHSKAKLQCPLCNQGCSSKYS